MQRKIAFVTGASVGIGRASAIALAESGYDLILLARRAERLHGLVAQLNVNIHQIVCDINSHDQLRAELTDIPEAFRNIDVLVNNAGLALGLCDAHEASWDDWQTMIETNCLSLAFLTRQVLPSMVKRNRGHIVNLGSTAESYPYKGGNVYGATKAFVEQFSNNLRADLLGKSIRVSHISPGLTGGTEFSQVRFHGDQKKADAVYAEHKALSAEDIAETIRWVVTQPLHVNINKIELMPTCQASAGLAIKSESV